MAPPLVSSSLRADFAHLPEPPESLDDTLGVLLIGNFVALILYGFTLHQAYYYVRSYPEDRQCPRLLVVLAVIFETFSSILGVHACYHYAVKNYYHSRNLQIGIWSLNLYPLIAGLPMVLSQSFFARRLWVLGHSYRLVVILSSMCMLAELGLFTAATAQLFIVNGSDDIPTLARLLPAGFVLALISDLMLTSMLIYVLRRSRTGIKRTDTMLDVLVKYSVSTGLLTGIFDLLTTILAFSEPNNYLYDAFGLPGAHLYTITLLTALNSRQSIAARAQTSDISPFGAGFDMPAQTLPQMPNVHIHTVQLRTDEATASLHIEFADLGTSQTLSHADSEHHTSLAHCQLRSPNDVGSDSRPNSSQV